MASGSQLTAQMAGGFAGAVPTDIGATFSTHDYTTPPNTSFKEVWADVAVSGSLFPGEGRTYVVGSVNVHSTVDVARGL